MWNLKRYQCLLHNPLKKHINMLLLGMKDNGEKAVVLCVIVDIKEKDKNNNAFAYLDLYTPYGIIEALVGQGI